METKGYVVEVKVALMLKVLLPQGWHVQEGEWVSEGMEDG